MNIYFVTRWGNDQEGPTEADTNFIVLAASYEAAAAVVDERLIKVKNSKAARFCHRITELGLAHTVTGAAQIVLGPSIENALYHDSVGIPNAKKWVRDSIPQGWIPFSDYYED